MKRKLAAVLCFSLVFAGMMTGCGSSEEVAEAAGDVLTDIKAGDREYGQTYEYQADEAMTTAFFDMSINSAELATTVEDYLPNNETDKFLVVNITIKNTFVNDPSIPMFDTDFFLTYDGMEEGDYLLPELGFADTLPEEYSIRKGDSKTGNLIYVVPGDKTDFSLEFIEVWDDDLEGNHFKIHFTPQAEA